MLKLSGAADNQKSTAKSHFFNMLVSANLTCCYDTREILHKLTPFTPLCWSQKVVSNFGSLRTTKKHCRTNYNLVVRGTTPFIFLIRTLCISYNVDSFFPIDYPFLLHCGIEKGPNLVVFQSHNASEKDNQWQKLDQQYSLLLHHISGVLRWGTDATCGTSEPLRNKGNKRKFWHIWRNLYIRLKVNFQFSVTVSYSPQIIFLLAMIFSGQEHPWIIFRRKDKYI